MQRFAWWLIGLAVVLASPVLGAPWDKILTSNRVEADPQKTYPITEKNGPWMIMACSFTAGEDEQTLQIAREQAHDLVIEIRKKYKLPAYTYEKKFDFGKEVTGRGVDRFGNPVRMRYKKGAQTQEVAVLVGDYSKADDPNAQATLKRLKLYQPECLAKKESSTLALSGWRAAQDEVRKALLPNAADKKKGPMGHAMVTTNPLLPSDYFVPKGVDALVVKANEGVEHSLLDCRGKYTVQVAHFTGKWITNQKEIEAIEKGKPMDSELVEATEKAHRMVEALRKHGYEAYEFHDRYASVVTVGSFDSVGYRDEAGLMHMDPKIQAVIDKFRGGDRVQNTGGAPVAIPKTLCDIAPEVKNEDNVPFTMQPILVETPKRSMATAISRAPEGQ